MFEVPFRLEVTDGTTTVDLVGGANGIYLNGWRPAAAGYKGGGIYQDSPIAPGRRLVQKQRANGIEQYDLKFSVYSPDQAIREAQELRRLLEKAADYWATDWQDTPVYLVKQGRKETNLSYAIIHQGQVPQDEFPYGQPYIQFDGRCVWDNEIVVIERGDWLSVIPGTGTNIPISALEEFNLVNYGNIDSTGARETTTANEVYVANKRNVANISHIYISNGPTLLTVPITLPRTLTLNSIGDYIAFGSDTSLDDSGPFLSLVFDLTTKMQSTTSYTLVWEYWDGAAWSLLTSQFTAEAFQDNTSSLSNLGVASVHWAFEAVTTWGTTALGGITAYWVRARVSALTGTLTSPIQGNRQIYSIVWPYIEVQAADIAGDIPALARIRPMYQNKTGTRAPSRIVAGLRSLSRGDQFTAYLNAADEQNPSCVTCAVVALSATTFETDVRAPAGRSALWTVPGASIVNADRIIFTISSAGAADFLGTFRVFGRFVPEQSGVFTTRLEVYALGGTVDLLSESITFPATSSLYHQIIDYGRFSIVGRRTTTVNDVIDSGGIEIRVKTGTTASWTSGNLYIQDIILIPVDEWAINADTVLTNTNPPLDNGQYLDIDNITAPKIGLRTVARSGGDALLRLWTKQTNGEAILHGNARQRLWFFASDYLPNGINNGLAETCHSLRVAAAQRYLGSRGNR